MTEVLNRLVWLILLCCALWHPTTHADEPLHITTAEALSFDDYGYASPPYEVNTSKLNGTWQTVTLPHAMERKLVPSTNLRKNLGPVTVETWYRVHLPELTVSDKPRYIYIPRWKADGQIAVYGDNRLLYQSHANLYWNGWNIPLLIALDESSDARPPKTILVRIERPRDSGGGISSIWLGEGDRLSWRYHLRYLLQVQLPYISSAAFLTAGLFSLLLWFRRRGEALYLLFFLVSLASFLRTLHYHVGENRLLISDEWFSWLTVISLFWLIAGVHFFLNHLHQTPSIWLNRIILFATASLSIIALPIFSTLPSVYLLSPLLYMLLMLMGTTVGIVGFYQSKRKHSREGKLLSVWCLLGMVFWLHDWLLQSNHIDIEGIYLGPYTNFIAFLLFLKIMFRRYIGAMNEVTQVNASLAQRLQTKELELQQIHISQREAAHRQTLADERQRLMQDMHDGLGSSLRTALLSVERGRIGNEVVAEVLKDCIDDLKLAIDSMEPVQADLLLLLATLRYRLGPRLESADIELSWEVVNVPALDWLDPRNALHILRILQEGFTNIIKHTQASLIRVATKIDNGWVVVTLTDNGQGFDVAQMLHSGGKGLNNQIRRAESIGAEIHWNSSHSGTTLTLRLPINR
jgi:signal transduction histidine kinase